LPIREEFVGVAMTGRGGSGTDLAVEFLVAKLPNRSGCQGRAFQARRRAAVAAGDPWQPFRFGKNGLNKNSTRGPFRGAQIGKDGPVTVIPVTVIP